MAIAELKDRPNLAADSRLFKLYSQFAQLLSEVRKQKLPENTIASINNDIAELNTLPDGDELRKAVKKKQAAIIKMLEKEYKIVPKNYYRNLWMAIGIGAIGLPFGALFSTFVRNMAFFSIGLPIGIAIGAGVGSSKDKKALEEGRQLDVEVKF